MSERWPQPVLPCVDCGQKRTTRRGRPRCRKCYGLRRSVSFTKQPITDNQRRIFVATATASYVDVAARFDLSPSRVGQVVKRVRQRLREGATL